MTLKRIILADAQPLYREGIKTIISKQDGLEIVDEVGNNEELIQSLHTHNPHLIIIDYNPNFFDLNKFLDWLKNNSSCKVIIISSRDKKYDILKLLQLNVYAYLTKESTSNDILNAINGALLGEKFFCDYVLKLMNNNLFNAPSEINKLTERELEIAKLVATGNKNKEIAETLIVSPHTIHTHRKNIMKKLNVSSAIELAELLKDY